MNITVYHLWNNTDVDVLNIIESFCGGNAEDTSCGIFHDNDQVYLSALCGSLILVLRTN